MIQPIIDSFRRLVNRPHHFPACPGPPRFPMARPEGRRRHIQMQNPMQNMHHPPPILSGPKLPGNTENSLRSDSPYSPARAKKALWRIL